MRKSTNLERRLRTLEGRFATLDPSITGDFSLADAHTEAEMAVETSQQGRSSGVRAHCSSGR